MESQDNASKSKLGLNWKIVALAAAVLTAGAVMGHSLLTSDRADTEETPAAPTTCAEQANEPGACDSKAEGSCCAKKSTCADSDATGESGCCAKKTAGCTGEDKSEGVVFQTSPSCCEGQASSTE